MIDMIEIFESEFMFTQALRPPRPLTGLLDTRWTMVTLGLTRDVILDWIRADEEGKKWYVSLIRQVCPGFMNRAMRRAVIRAFNDELTRIYNRGMVPVLEIDTATARRIGDFRTSH